MEAGLVRELVISDGGSSDETRSIAEAAGAVWVTGSPSRGGQLRRGCTAAEGDWLLLLHADTHLPNGWPDLVLQLMSTQSAGYFDLGYRSGGWRARCVAGWANLRSRLLGLPYGDQGLLVQTSRLAEIGGVPDQPLMEDVALARALRGRLRPIGARVATSFEKYERGGVLNRGTRNLGLLIRYALGAKPENLARQYRR